MADTALETATAADRWGISNALSLNMPVIGCFVGDSKGDEPRKALLWLSAWQPFELTILGSGVPSLTDIQGGSTSGTSTTSNGLITTTRLEKLATMLSANLSLGYQTDLYLTMGTNDFGNGTTADQSVSNMRKYVNAFLATPGSRYAVIMGVDPRTPATDFMSFAKAFNNMWAEIAASDPRIEFVDPIPYMADLSSAVYQPIGGDEDAIGDVGALHDNPLGILQQAYSMRDVVSRLYPRRSLVWPYPGASSALQRGGEILGANARTTALGGTVDGTTAGTGTITGTPPAGWRLEGNLRGLSVTFSAVSNSAPFKSLLKSLGDVPVVAMEWSGTPTGLDTEEAQIILRKLQSHPTTGLGQLEVGGNIVWWANPGNDKPLTNVLRLDAHNYHMTDEFGGLRVQTLGATNGVTATHPWTIIPNVPDGLYFMDRFGGRTANGAAAGAGGNYLTFGFKPGVATSGLIHLFGSSLFIRSNIPAAAA